MAVVDVDTAERAGTAPSAAARKLHPVGAEGLLAAVPGTSRSRITRLQFWKLSHDGLTNQNYVAPSIAPTGRSSARIRQIEAVRGEGRLDDLGA